MEPTKTYQQPAEFGTWYFENEGEEAMGIETARYDNGSVSKRAKLSDGRTAICRRLRGKDRLLIKRIIGDEKEKFEDAMIAIATKIDDKDIIMEDLADMWFNDVITVQTMAQSLNFT